MNDLTNRLASLDLEKSKLLQATLRKRGLLTGDVVASDQRQSAQLSFTQQRLWFLDQLEPNNVSYNVHLAMRIIGQLNQIALARALEEVVRRHEVLRTVFVMKDEELLQVVMPTLSVPLIQVDLRGTPSVERQAQVRQLTTEAAARPFDLARGPLLTATLYRLDEQEHVFLVVQHHIISDGWSIGIFLEELTTLYEAFVQGKPSPLPPLAVQYGDFALWQQKQVRTDKLEAQLAYWRERLQGIPPILEWPTDYPRPPEQRFLGARYTRWLKAEIGEGLKQVSREGNATLFMTLLAGFAVLVRRYTGETDVVVGTPIANRPREELEKLLGVFVNTLALRVDVSGDPPFQELLKRVRQGALEAYAHPDVPFEVLVEALRPERDLSRTPLFQTMFVMQYEPTLRQLAGGLKLRPFEVDNRTAKFDLSLLVQESGTRLKIVFEYRTDLFAEETIARLGQHFETLLAGIVAQPRARVSELPLMDAAERRQVLEEWNATEIAYPDDVCLHELFAAQAARTPEAEAVRYEGTSLSYAELNARANQVAHTLRTLGVGAETRVGVCLQRSLELVVGLLGILKAGGTYVPLDPSYPAARLAFMLTDAQVAVLLTQERLLPILPTSSVPCLCLDRDWPAIHQCPRDNPISVTRPENAAYIIYTSGSTGQPNGVIGPHGATVNRLQWMWTKYPFTRADVCCQKTSLSFVDSVWEIWGPLLQGVSNILVPDDVVYDPARLFRFLEQNQVTRIVLVPSLLCSLLDSRLPWRQLSHLQYWVTSGEALSAALARRFHEHIPQGLLLNLYGSSEVAADVTCQEVLADAVGQIVSIGRPISNTRVYILDSSWRPVPVGVSGELCVGGANLARGYFNRPALTAQRFVPDPCGKSTGGRLYRTGDLARYRSDGSIEFLGRRDHQEKLRGFRIELREVETCLANHPAVQEVVVKIQEDSAGDKQLIAYLVPGDHDVLPDEHALRRHMRQYLPEHMIPAYFVYLEALPLTPSRKIDRTALPRVEPRELHQTAKEGLELTPTETALEALWCEVLGIDAVGRDDNFFDLGGHSLLAAKIIARVRSRFGVEVTVRDLFGAPTISGMTGIVETAIVMKAEGIAVDEILDQIENIDEATVRVRLTKEASHGS